VRHRSGRRSVSGIAILVLTSVIFALVATGAGVASTRNGISVRVGKRTKSFFASSVNYDLILEGYAANADQAWLFIDNRRCRPTSSAEYDQWQYEEAPATRYYIQGQFKKVQRYAFNRNRTSYLCAYLLLRKSTVDVAHDFAPFVAR
jgi:hypothetical protein